MLHLRDKKQILEITEISLSCARGSDKAAQLVFHEIDRSLEIVYQSGSTGTGNHGRSSGGVMKYFAYILLIHPPAFFASFFCISAFFLPEF